MQESFFHPQATSLNCSHSFCSFCIRKWQESKKDAVCPNCREKIKSSVRSLVLDNYIDKAVEVLSDEVKERRRQVVEERKGILLFESIWPPV